MSDSSPEDSSLSRYSLEDTLSTLSTPSIDSSKKSSPAASSPRRISSHLVSFPGANLQQVNSAPASPPAASYPQGNTPLAGLPKPIYPRVTSPRPIPLRSGPPEGTPPDLIFPRANPPPASSPRVDNPRVSSPETNHPRSNPPRANPPQTDPSEIDAPESSQRPMKTCPDQHLRPSHHGDVHSIFLRAFHSPWSGIGRRLALAIRGFIALYMTVTFTMVVAWQARTEAAASMVMFKFETISFLWQMAYSWITFVR